MLSLRSPSTHHIPLPPGTIVHIMCTYYWIYPQYGWICPKYEWICPKYNFFPPKYYWICPKYKLICNLYDWIHPKFDLISTKGLLFIFPYVLKEGGQELLVIFLKTTGKARGCATNSSVND